MDRVWQVLENKGHDVWSIGPDNTVFEALERLAEKDIGALIVLEGEKVVGIFSERDYARKVALQGKRSTDIPVREVMSTNVLFVRPDQGVDECMALMTDKHIRHLPVMDGSRLVGVISIGDLVKSVISHQEFIIAQLENYITGGR
ncbi:MAG: CBS domain-containing protein [Chloroflexi bacterium]|jgi:CBS domain-containing protein|nr:CBS domain-containing protein [Chloroflexota bacterium]